MSYATGLAGPGNVPVPGAPPYVETILNTLSECNNLAAQVWSMLDRALGGMPPSGADKISAVPSGALERIQHDLSDLRDVLETIASRSQRIA